MSEAILIVDDSLTVRMDLIEAFAAAGFEARACPTLAEARAVLDDGPVDVLVLDVRLPDGDGIDLLTEVRASRSASDTAVLMLSTEAEVRDRIRGLRTGADEYIGKPYDTSYVIAKARELLGKRHAGRRTGQPSVLVIDDSLTFREELRGALESAGYTVLVAATGEAGLRIAADERPGAIVVDGVLPGIDGATCIRRLRLDAALRGLPCLLLTGSEDSDAELRALDAGADDFVRKDEGIEIIQARLATMLRDGTVPWTEATASLLGPKKILAVDDSITYLEEVSAALHHEGYDVVQARSGEEALELLAVQPVDCILLDMVLPGLSGQDTCRRIKAAPGVCHIPLIMLTACEDRASMLEGLGAGADDYVQKSSELEVLKARVRAQLRRKQFEDENGRIREELLRKEHQAAEARAVLELAATRARLLQELERKNHDLEILNQELKAFSYSVSHDLRAPLRSIDGFSQTLLKHYADRLDEQGRRYLDFVCKSAQHMGQLIDDLLALARITREDFRPGRVDLSALAHKSAHRLRAAQPARQADFVIQEGLSVDGDARLLAVALENLLGNAWKFTTKRKEARIELGRRREEGGEVYFVRDNGAGFDMRYANKLFGEFQRLHSAAEFEGTGIGLATVRRVIRRHGGRVWAEGLVDQGATFYFTLGEKEPDR